MNLAVHDWMHQNRHRHDRVANVFIIVSLAPYSFLHFTKMNKWTEPKIEDRRLVGGEHNNCKSIIRLAYKGSTRVVTINNMIKLLW